MDTPYFYHNENGTVNINNHIFSIDLFKLIEPNYTLLKGATSRRYIPGIKHTVGYKSYQKGQSKVWPDGDRYISRVHELIYLINNFQEYDLIHMKEVLKQQMKKKMNLID